MIQNDFSPTRVLAERRLKGLANHTAIAPQAWRGKVSTRLRKRCASERSSAAGGKSAFRRPSPSSATPFLGRQASWPAALRPRNERRAAARPAIPPKPISIIAQVAGSGAAGGSSTGPPNESVNRTSPKNPNPLPFVRLERRISIGAPASALVAV